MNGEILVNKKKLLDGTKYKSTCKNTGVNENNKTKSQGSLDISLPAAYDVVHDWVA